MQSISKHLFYLLTSCAMVGLALGSGGANPVAAQTPQAPSESGERFERTYPNREKGRDSNLPSWAEPVEQPSEASRAARQNGEGTVAMNAPSPPPDPDPIPVNGGLLWLVVAGGGYATWTLREDK